MEWTEIYKLTAIGVGCFAAGQMSVLLVLRVIAPKRPTLPRWSEDSASARIRLVTSRGSSVGFRG